MGSSSLTQSSQQLAMDCSSLGKDKMLLIRFTGREEVSRPFLFQLEMLSKDGSISPEAIVGKPVLVTLKGPDGSSRYFHGLISNFSHCGTDDRWSHYHAEMVSWLWFLNLQCDCQIFQNLSIPQIIEQVFNDAGLTDFEKSEIKGSHPKRDYCVQYRESDFNFVSRLMEQEGIFYYFRHEQSRHVLVLADQMGAFKDCRESQLDYAVFKGGHESSEKLRSWTHRYQFHPGKYTETDYNFETPSANLLVSTKTVVKWDKIKNYEVYDYPGGHTDKGNGNADLKLRMEAAEATHDLVEGSGVCRSFTAGGKFKIGRHQNKKENGKTFGILSVGHSIALGGAYGSGGSAATEYSNGFTCLPTAIVFRPPRLTLKPVVQGPQTAVVVGPSGEEIYTDKYGRVKVQFYWDRNGKRDEKSSCWVRVSQFWAGKNWGAIHIPRIGQEVIVEFLEGDPDRPIITGNVYNNDLMPPHELPAKKTRSGIKSRSTKNGSPANFNEIRFEDDKGNEEIHIHAERKLRTTVEADETRYVGGGRSTTIEKDEILEIKKGKREETLDQGNDKLTISKGDRECDILQGKDTLSVQTGDIEISAPSGTFHVSAKEIKIEGMTKITLSVGGNSITLDPSSIKISGIMIQSQASGIQTIQGSLVKINS